MIHRPFFSTQTYFHGPKPLECYNIYSERLVKVLLASTSDFPSWVYYTFELASLAGRSQEMSVP